VPGREQTVEVGGRRLVLRNLDKVLYPSTGMTKGEVIAYTAAVAGTTLPHLADRPVTRMRWPDGVDGPMFVEKNLPRGTPDWVRTVTLDTPGSSTGRERIVFPLADDLPTLVWAANLAALELHVPQWKVGPRGGVRNPDRLVVDLDPGAPAGLAECAEVAHAVRERLAGDGLDCYPVTSGSKGMQLYAPISAKQDADVVREYARRLAESLERQLPKLVVSRMTKSLRPGKVLLDWSQNHHAKTTVAPYSMRGRGQPWVAAPRGWDELDGGLVQLGTDDVLARLDGDGDLLEPLLEPGPRLPL
jgi:bifunctional non-homologous end joining protein LigD